MVINRRQIMSRNVGIIKKRLNSDSTILLQDQVQLKMIFDKDFGVGIYLMGNKTPMPAKFCVNKFGPLEIELITDSEKFSFAKLP